MDRFEEIMKDGDIIFHYTKLGVALEHILFHRRLQFSYLLNMNDPRERNYWSFGQPMFIDDSSFNKMLQLQIILNEIRTSEYKIACFCANKIAAKSKSESENFSVSQEWYGWNRLRMWAQYADNFRGVCIALSASAIKKKLAEEFNDEYLIKEDIVDYLPNYYEHDRALRDIDPAMISDGVLEKYAASYIKENLSRFFLTKPIDYRDECEYRIVVHDPADKFEYLDVSACIRGVILGDKCHNVYHGTVMKLCEELNVECRKFAWVAGRMSFLKLWYQLGKGSGRELEAAG